MFALLIASALAGDGSAIRGIALSDLAKDLPRCEAQAPVEAAFDLDSQCIRGLCDGATWTEVLAIWGQPDRCSDAHGGGHFCDFAEGSRRIRLMDVDDDGQPSEGDRVKALWVKSADVGATHDGLQVGSSAACFLERYGDQAIGVDVDVKNGRLFFRSVQFREPRTIIRVDEQGRVASIQL